MKYLVNSGLNRKRGLPIVAVEDATIRLAPEWMRSVTEWLYVPVGQRPWQTAANDSFDSDTESLMDYMCHDTEAEAQAQLDRATRPATRAELRESDRRAAARRARRVA